MPFGLSLPSLTHPARRTTAPHAETRGALTALIERGGIEEALSAEVSSQRLKAGVGRATYASADPTIQAALKRFDVQNRSRKITLYQAFLGEAAISASVEAIAARMISGGWTLKPVNPKHPNEATREPLLEFLNWCNPDETFAQVLHSTATDLLWAGEAYLETTWKPQPSLSRTVPYELYTVDPISMDYTLAEDRKSIGGYVQTTDDGKKVDLTPDQVIRIWFPNPRNRFAALSPIEKLLYPVTTDTYLQLGEVKRFEQGNWTGLSIDFPDGDQDQAGRFLTWLRQKFLGVKNSHLPLVTFGGAKVTQTQVKETDVLARRKYTREEITSVYKVPPHWVSVVEHGGLGSGGLSEALDKQGMHTAVEPVKQRILEPLNFRLTVLGFGIDDWLIDTSYADFRDTAEVDKVLDQQVRGGRRTPNEARAEMKLDPIDGGDVAIIVAGKDVYPIATLPQLADGSVSANAQDGAAGGSASENPVGAEDDEGDDTSDALAMANARKGAGRPDTRDPHNPAESAGSQPTGDNLDTVGAAERELAKWERSALKRVREGKPPRPWQAEAISREAASSLNEALAAAVSEADVRTAFARFREPAWLTEHIAETQAAVDSYGASIAERIAREIAQRAQP